MVNLPSRGSSHRRAQSSSFLLWDDTSISHDDLPEFGPPMERKGGFEILTRRTSVELEQILDKDTGTGHRIIIDTWTPLANYYMTGIAVGGEVRLKGAKVGRGKRRRAVFKREH